MALFRRKKDPRSTGISPVIAGVIALVLILAFTFFGFTRYNPFSSPYQLVATFHSANNLQPKSPVRIAGVNVGTVKSVDPIPGGTGAARVTMEIQDQGLPIHKDAVAKIRSRTFLEGNFFIDLSPGSPSSPVASTGYSIPVQQTATPVQFDQVLSALQANTRQDLQTLLKEYAEKGLGNGGAAAYNRTLNTSPDALRYSAIASQATLGTQPHDLSNLIRGQQRLAKSLSSNPQALQDLVVSLNTTTNAFARESTPLEQSIPLLRDTLNVGTPALRSVDNALPSLRTFAREALPGTISSGPTIDASLPTITQLRLLVRPSELEGLVRDLRPTIPALAKLNAAAIPLLNESRTLSACQNNVLLPFSQAGVPNPDFPGIDGQPFYKQVNRSFVGLAGESRYTDANTPFFNVQAGAGATTVVTSDSGKNYFSAAPAAPEGTRPAKPDHRPNFRPGAPCELQTIPDLNAPGGPASQSVTETVPGGLLPPLTPALAKVAAAGKAQVAEEQYFLAKSNAGKPAVDPLAYPPSTYKSKMKQMGLGVTAQGKVYSLPSGAAK